MTTPVETIPPTTTVTEASAQMADLEINALVVLSDAPGIVTSTDIVRVIGAGKDPSTTSVEEAMTAPIETVERDRPLREVASVMTEFGVKHLPVMDEGVIGMVSSTDVAAYLPRYESPV